MRLASMMRLVVEKMQQDVGERLLLWFAGGRLVGTGARQCAFVIARDQAHDPIILRGARARQIRQVLIEDLMKLKGLLTFTRQPRQPKSIGQQKVVERRVQAAKKHADIATIQL